MTQPQMTYDEAISLLRRRSAWLRSTSTRLPAYVRVNLPNEIDAALEVIARTPPGPLDEDEGPEPSWQERYAQTARASG